MSHPASDLRDDCLYLHKATRFISRLRGLHAYGQLGPHTGLLITPCSAVHTFGLGYPIDVVFLGKELQVVKVVSAMQPGRLAVCLKADCVVELVSGYCAAFPAYAQSIRRAIASAMPVQRSDNSHRTH